jgi:metal-responsive CopG/Arc/MetJ family transcriptional regulator
MADPVRIQVLMPKAEGERFEAYCREKGYKKSPLIARLVREYLDSEGFNPQPDLFNREQQGSKEL